MRTPLHHWDAPADIASLHPEIGQWQRQGAWRRAKERDSFEALFASPGGAERRRVVVHRTSIRRAEAVLWSLENGKSISSAALRERSQSRRRRRPGKRKREAMQHGGMS